MQLWLWRVVIEGSCSFLSLPRLNSVLSSVPAGSHVTIDLAVDFFDHPAYETLSAWQRQHESTGRIRDRPGPVRRPGRSNRFAVRDEADNGGLHSQVQQHHVRRDLHDDDPEVVLVARQEPRQEQR